MSGFFEIVGIITVTVFFMIVFGVIYWLFVHPIFQAISLARWFGACMNHIGEDLSFSSKWKIFKSYYEVGGVSFESTRNNAGCWHGIGDWRIYEDESE
ncbi:hypothetical protein DEEACLCL_00100 [Salmonella phage CRW-SP2]|nr:hypothetical protein DEEACLCL_00100 [Salmonella phage CRW-SP2]